MHVVLRTGVLPGVRAIRGFRPRSTQGHPRRVGTGTQRGGMERRRKRRPPGQVPVWEDTRVKLPVRRYPTRVHLSKDDRKGTRDPETVPFTQVRGCMMGGTSYVLLLSQRFTTLSCLAPKIRSFLASRRSGGERDVSTPLTGCLPFLERIAISRSN